MLKANNLQRRSGNVIFNNIYFTPVVTLSQRKQAYELRVERRSKENKVSLLKKSLVRSVVFNTTTLVK